MPSSRSRASGSTAGASVDAGACWTCGAGALVPLPLHADSGSAAAQAAAPRTSPVREKRVWATEWASECMSPLLLLPVECAAHGLPPAAIQALALGVRHLRRELPVERPVAGHVLLSVPVADGEAGQVRRAERGGQIGRAHV